MQHIARIPILFIFLLLFISCGDPACELLDEAERIVDQSPAEASVLLKKVDPALIGDEDDRALYGLLSVQTRIERGLPYPPILSFQPRQLIIMANGRLKDRSKRYIIRGWF